MNTSKKESFLTITGKRILFIISAFFLMYFVSYIIDPYSEYWSTFFTRSIPELIEDVLMTLFCSVIIAESSIFINKKLNNKISWTKNPVQRLAIETILNIVMALLVNILLTVICISQSGSQSSIFSFNLSVEETKGLIHWVVVSSVLAFMFMAFNTGNYLIVNWKNEIVKASEMSRIAAEAEIQALKMQIDPHFVFNNLSVLSELILCDQQIGHEYAERFSKIYRYMLINSKKNTIQLSEELKFLNDYIFLLDKRIGAGATFQLEIPEQYLNKMLPPMTLQLLVENALKHNKTLKSSPLEIRITVENEDELIISNNIQPFESPIESSGIGLENIKRRYKLLSDRQPIIINDTQHFVVTIPLLS